MSHWLFTSDLDLSRLFIANSREFRVSLKLDNDPAGNLIILPYKLRGHHCVSCYCSYQFPVSQSITVPSIIFHFAIQFSSATLCVFCI